MNYGIIDIGSNTIRGVAYSVEGNRAVKTEDKLVRSHILRETKNGKLSENGINRLVAVLSKLRYILKKARCSEIYCFGTSAMRGIENIDEVKQVIYDTTTLSIDALSGKEEAECDFVALRANIAERSAIGIDLGGGSCQIIQFERNNILFSDSYDIGSNRVRREIVKNNIPTDEEQKKIAAYVRNRVIEHQNMIGHRYIYVMGGTAKAAVKIYKSLFGAASTDTYLSIENMEKICSIAREDSEKMYEFFTRVVKNRADTVIPGIIVLKTVCELFDVDGIYVLSCTMRDGYFTKLMKEKSDESKG
ncbi:MAG: hypothetical protein IKR46_03955 [Clostridia bacterium]|nr:hypothetical protein [Clostridia bacterium]